MFRTLSLCAMFLLLTLAFGCGGVKEVKPDESKTPKVDQADIQQQIEEGMKKGGMDEYSKRGMAPGGSK